MGLQRASKNSRTPQSPLLHLNVDNVDLGANDLFSELRQDWDIEADPENHVMDQSTRWGH